MFARSAKFLALFGLLAFSQSAEARRWTFETHSPFGIGLLAGLSQNPDSDLTGKPQHSGTSFSHFFGFEPFLDFGVFSLRASGQLHASPVYSATGANYSETSDVGSFHYGLQVQFAPYISESKTNRVYLKVGIAQARAQGKNTRTYDNGLAYRENFEGTANEMIGGAGFEFFLVQNYSLQLEGGYRQLEFEKLTYEGGTDLQGNAKNKGEALLNADGTNKKLNHSGAYVSLGLNLNF